MNSSPRPPKPAAPRGFTLIELMVVIAVILVLITLSVTVLRSALRGARRSAAETTVQKVSKLLGSRSRALEAYCQRIFRNENDPEYKAFVRKIQAEMVNAGIRPALIPAEGQVHFWRVMVFKYLHRRTFPQASDRDNAILAADPEIRAMLYQGTKPLSDGQVLHRILFSSTVFGATDGGEGEFSAQEVVEKPVDGDATLKAPAIVDSWGNELHMYRCPWQVLQADSSLAKTVYTNIPEAPNLRRDPHDPLGVLEIWIQNARSGASIAQSQAIATYLARNYDAFNRYSVPMVISAGPDQKLGVMPIQPAPTATADLYSTTPADLSHLDPSNLKPMGKFAAPVSTDVLGSNDLFDDVTSLNSYW